jgi:hypothetical protein
MSARAWDKVDYSRVASVCMKNNKKHFEVRPIRHNCLALHHSRNPDHSPGTRAGVSKEQCCGFST